MGVTHKNPVENSALLTEANPHSLPITLEVGQGC